MPRDHRLPAWASNFPLQFVVIVAERVAGCLRASNHRIEVQFIEWYHARAVFFNKSGRLIFIEIMRSS